jgi:hypothetical protein
VGPVVHQVADGVEVALGGQAALGDHQHPDPNRSTSSSTWLDTTTQRPSSPSGGTARSGAAAGGGRGRERLVEDDHLGVVHDAWATFTRWRMPFE